METAMPTRHSSTVVFCVSGFKSSLGVSRPPVGEGNATRDVH